MLVCLGDLFRVWLALPKFWAPIHQKVMAAFAELRSRGVSVVFVIGNREAVFPNLAEESSQTRFPIDHLVSEDCCVTWGDRRYGFAHGDNVNRKDTRYLRWRKFVRSRAFDWLFRMMPRPVASYCAHRLEAVLATTNSKFRTRFPEEEIIEYGNFVLSGVDYYFIGHFHQDREFRFPHLRGRLRVVPDWASKRSVIRIDRTGKVTTLQFSNKELKP